MKTSSSNWYEKAFDKGYLKRYSHRSAELAEAEVDWVITKTGVSKDARILDACCGQGRHLKNWLDKGYNACGFDLSTDLIELSYTPHAVVRADQRHWPYVSNRFDLVTVMFTSIGYFTDDIQNQLIFEEASRVLKKEGKVVIDAANPDYLKEQLVPESVKNLPEGTLIEKRWFEGNRVNKKVLWKTQEGDFDYLESVRLFTLGELKEILIKNKLELKSCHRGFYAEDQSRLILIAEKS